MERQRCVINAVVQQTTPDKVLANYQAIASAGENTIETDVPRTLLPALVDLGLKVKGTKLRSVVFTPSTGFSSSNPNWPAAQKKVQKALKETKADAEDESSGTKKKKKTKSDDLTKICAYNPAG
jgi:anionic cell wall polymer biosynthesis LytR-Cps2A-Psr (LCP) family protein